MTADTTVTMDERVDFRRYVVLVDTSTGVPTVLNYALAANKYRVGPVKDSLCKHHNVSMPCKDKMFLICYVDEFDQLMSDINNCNRL